MQPELQKALNTFLKKDAKSFDAFMKDIENQEGIVEVQNYWVDMLGYCVNQIDKIKTVKATNIEIIIKDFCKLIVYGGNEGNNTFHGLITIVIMNDLKKSDFISYLKIKVELISTY
jgi:hypothetical protein